MVVMLPIYTCEFCIVYAMRIPVVATQPWILPFVPLFNFSYHWPVFEQMLYFGILACFFMSVSCFKLVFAHD